MSRRKHRPVLGCDRFHVKRKPATHELRAEVARVTPYRGAFTYRVRLCRTCALLELRQARFWGRAHRVRVYRFRRLP